MSQNQIVKFGIIPVIFALTFAAGGQWLTSFQPDQANKQNVDKTKPSSQASITTAESGDVITKHTQVSDRFQDGLKQSSSEQPEKSTTLRSPVAGEEPDSQRQIQLESAEKIESDSTSEYLGFFNLNQQLDHLQSFHSQVKPSHTKESEALFLSLISAKTTAWKFFVPEADRVLPQDVDRSITTGENSHNLHTPQATVVNPPEVSQKSDNTPQATVANPPEASQKPETVAVGVKSIEPPPIARSKTATNHISTGLYGDNVLFELFGTPDAPGALAIGAAEGTRTASGQVTSSYWGHSDPGNGVNNIGTFSYQHEAPTPRQADWRQLKRLQGQVEQIMGQAQEKGVNLSTLELVAGADLLNQSPAAGMSYVHNLKQARDRGLKGINAVLQARVMSFVNPETGVLEAAGFGNSWEILRQDQWRRLVNLNQTLELHGVI